MKSVFRHTTPLWLAAALLVGALSGCALYPAVQVAGGAMTGYDAVVLADDYIPRQSVEGGSLCAIQDRTLERRLRERLVQNGLGDISAHVIDSNAYLLGCMATRSRADKAVKTAVTVTGLHTVTVKFYPLPSEDQRLDDQALTQTLTERLAETARLKRADLRVQVIEGNAILVGRTEDYSQKSAALAIAHEIGGIRDVVDYIRVPAPTGQADDNRRLAAN